MRLKMEVEEMRHSTGQAAKHAERLADVVEETRHIKSSVSHLEQQLSHARRRNFASLENHCEQKSFDHWEVCSWEKRSERERERDREGLNQIPPHISAAPEWALSLLKTHPTNWLSTMLPPMLLETLFQIFKGRAFGLILSSQATWGKWLRSNQEKEESRSAAGSSVRELVNADAFWLGGLGDF